MDKVVSWVKYEKRFEVAELIKKDYNNPRAVLDFITEHVKPI